MPIQTAIDSISNSQGSPFGFKNRIINGAMVIDQRNAGASVTPTTGTYTVDRWRIYASQTSKLTAQQNAGSVTPPAGYANYLGMTSSSAYSVISSDLFLLQQFIEGYNSADLAWGTASAQPVTLSFWVRSSLTGVFGVNVQSGDGNTAYSTTYTVNSANTWEQKTITVTGPTSGTWLTTNGKGIVLNFIIGVGSASAPPANNAWQSANYYGAIGAQSLLATNGATLYITGVQLEKGTQATAFDYRPYGTELALCQRYYFVVTGNKSNSSYPALGSGNIQSSTNARIYVKYPVDMRAAPTASISGTITISCDTDRSSTSIGVAYNGISSSMLGFTISSGTTSNGATAYTNGTNNYVDFSAEL